MWYFWPSGHFYAKIGFFFLKKRQGQLKKSKTKTPRKVNGGHDNKELKECEYLKGNSDNVRKSTQKESDNEIAISRSKG